MMKQLKAHWLLGVVSVHVGLSMLAFAQTPGSAKSSLVLKSVELPAQSSDGVPIEEISGLAWDDQAKLLYAVSDRGHLHHLTVDDGKSGELSIAATWSGKIERNSVNSRNAEGLAMRRNQNAEAELLVALEDPVNLSLYGSDGKVTGDIALPARLTSGSGNDGIEAVTFTDDGKIAYALEKPIEPDSAAYHEIVVTGPGTPDVKLRFPRASGMDTRVKAIESLGKNNFLVLERDKNNTSGAYRSFLTKVSECKGESILTCKTESALAEGQTLPDEALEGMALLDNGTIVLVEDRKRKAGPTRLFIIQP